MDLSQDYIGMCKAAIEIQAYRCMGQNVKGDYFWHPIDPIRVIDSEAMRKIEDNSIWLPRQDQLQEIVGRVDELRKHNIYSDYMDEYQISLC